MAQAFSLRGLVLAGTTPLFALKRAKPKAMIRPWWERAMRKKKKKLSLDEAAEALTRIAERHLSKLPEEEQESRVAAFSRVTFKKKTRGNHPTPSKTARTRAYPAAARGRG